MILEIVPLVVRAAAEEAGLGSGTQVLIAALGAGSIGAVMAAAITGLFTKRKLGAEATEIITKAASGVVESLNEELGRMTALVTKVRAEAADAAQLHIFERQEDRDRHARELDGIRRVLQLHVAWDLMAAAKLAEYGIDLPEPPPLTPPLREMKLE